MWRRRRGTRYTGNGAFMVAEKMISRRSRFRTKLSHR
jgi:hypothetical protein